MRTLKRLAEDGLEYIGTLTLPGSVVVGDPGAFGAPAGGDSWFGATVQPGTWHLLGRAWAKDGDLLEELVLVHADHLGAFYDQYDELADVATVALPHHRLVVVAGGLEHDVALLRSLSEPEADALPWVADDQAIVLSSIAELPGQIATSRTSPVVMLAIGLARAPFQPAGTHQAPET